ncbi:unnamed protein product, partial [Nesidiocoris tenuis]
MGITPTLLPSQTSDTPTPFIVRRPSEPIHGFPPLVLSSRCHSFYRNPRSSSTSRENHYNSSDKDS